jgi:hypothetical protein
MMPFAADAYPHVVELTAQHIRRPGCSYEYGLGLILDGREAVLRG